MSELKHLNIKRGAIKANITRCKTFFEKIKTTKVDANIVRQLNARLRDLTPSLQEFNEIQLEIEYISSTDTEEYEPQIDVREEFESNYYALTSEIEQVIAEYEKEHETVAQSNLGSVNLSVASNNFVHNNAIRLPTIDLPKFEGSYDNWLEFRDAFDGLVNKNNNLTNIQKFYYLRSSLKDSARNIIENIEMSDSNYDIAWNLLQERYNNNKSILYKHIDSILGLPNMQKESLSDLRYIVDSVAKHLRSLKTLGQPVESWDTLIVHLINKKLDPTTRKEWETHEINIEISTWNDLREFLNNKCRVLEKIEPKGHSHDIKTMVRKNRRESSQAFSTTIEEKCFNCNGNHSIFKCEAFLGLTPAERSNKVKQLRLCFNCLRKNHFLRQCKSFHSCRHCHKKHNTLLHSEQVETHLDNNETTSSDTNEQPNTLTVSNHTTVEDKYTQVLLSTAIIHVEGNDGKLIKCRAILDSGSQSSFMTEELSKQLGLKKSSINIAVVGINQTASAVNQRVQVKLKSLVNSFEQTTLCLILPKITEALPTVSFDKNKLKIPPNIKLADPTFNKTGKIDMLLGSNIFWQLICVGQIPLGKEMPRLQKTVFGWIIGGQLQHSYMNQTISNFSRNLSNTLEHQIAKFWELEEVNHICHFSKEEIECENHFVENIKRNEDGRFIVSIPFNEKLAHLGNTREMALNRFHSLEKRFVRQSNVKQEYQKVIEDYQASGHMTKIKEEDAESAFYLPHHAVIKESSSTTKVRVVFDGSMKSDAGISLNDAQRVGPTIQSDLISILLRFRKHKYVIAGDIAKMYRQVLIKPEQRRYQRIFWRSDQDEDLQCFELNTVTFGTASAPFLAIRCLQQIADENAKKFPIAASIIKRDFYVDDLLTGGDTVEDVLQNQQQVNSILKSACFDLRKWLTNEPSISKNFPINEVESSVLVLGEKNEVKILGISWNAVTDHIQYDIKTSNFTTQATKRSILSTVAQIYDPLGLLSPITVTAKLIIQRLWQLKTSWDESIPMDLHTQWLRFQDRLPTLNMLKINRHVVCKNPKWVELHAFSDASERAYGACVYIRSIDNNNIVTVRLLCAKSKVAPLKNVTLPRLELLGVVLLANLIDKVKQSLNVSFSEEFYWCDSTITLHWINAPPNKWTTFVANRVAQVQNLVDTKKFRHVGSQDNPADLVSRGINPADLLTSKLWFNGPSWLMQEKPSWPENQIHKNKEELPETKKITLSWTTTTVELDLFKTCSSLPKMQRIFAYCLRFITNMQLSKQKRRCGPLTIDEVQTAMQQLIKIAQHQAFTAEIVALQNSRQLSIKGSLLGLNPFLDTNGLLRVGGRIQKSNFEYSKKHPVILPPKHNLTNLIIRNEHYKMLHCGAQALLAFIREQYWPISGRNLVKKVIHDCIVCFKVNPKSTNYLMGDLPAARITQAPPFANVGLDYAGPFLLKDRQTRGAKLIKAYICLFVCLVTKAYHLELITDLTSNAFLASLKRFTARRGKPINIYSDNGTNFVGANTELKNLYNFIKGNSDTIQSECRNEQIQWHFIPPRAPNFGGLWEAGVKNIKYHLRRVIGNANLTYESFCTVLAQIESILNSRPLVPVSCDPNDLEPITPAHFLIGRSLTALPDRNLIDIKENKLSMYQRQQQLIQHFWTRWNKEYVSQLQVRTKWKQQHSQLLKPGTLVLIKEDNLPPLKWHLGRVLELHPGQDKVVRVVTIKTATSIVKRAVSKVCALPISESD